jgi:hypothetical protein
MSTRKVEKAVLLKKNPQNPSQTDIMVTKNTVSKELFINLNDIPIM